MQSCRHAQPITVTRLPRVPDTHRKKPVGVTHTASQSQPLTHSVSPDVQHTQPRPPNCTLSHSLALGLSQRPHLHPPGPSAGLQLQQVTPFLPFLCFSFLLFPLRNLVPVRKPKPFPTQGPGPGRSSQMTDKPCLPPTPATPHDLPSQRGELGWGLLLGAGKTARGEWRKRSMGRLARGGARRVQCPGLLCPPKIPGGRELTLQASVPPPPPTLAPFSFEAGGEGGWWQEGGVEASQPTSECPFLPGWLPTLAWPTGPHKALPVSLAAPHPTPTCPCPWADRQGSQEAHGMNVEQMQEGQEGFPGEADRGGQKAGGSSSLPCRPGAGATSAHSVAHSTCHTQASLSASLSPSSLLLQSQIGSGRWAPVHTLHVYWTCTHNHTGHSQSHACCG